MKTLLAYDKLELTSREITPEGYLRAPATLARTGVQTYLAHELGLDGEGMDPMKPIRLYRPPEEVFNPQSMESFNHQPVTVDHPPEGVTAANWSKLAVGDAHGIVRSGNNMDGVLIVRDAKAVKIVQQDGKTALSNGYNFDLDLTSGTAPDGGAYDGIQRNIRGNHIAIVDAARCGPACRIADHQPKGDSAMATRKITVDGIPGEADDAICAAIDKQVKDLADTKTALKIALDAVKGIKIGDKTFTLDELVALVSTQTKQIEELKKDVMTPAARDAMVADWAKTISEAKRLSPDVTTDGKTCLQIRRDVLKAVGDKNPVAKEISAAVLGAKTIEDGDADTIRSAFNAVAASVKADAVDATSARASDKAVADALTGGTGTQKLSANDAKPTGRSAFLERSANAWQGNKG